MKDAADEITPSVTLLLNRSTSSHTFPSIWKCAKVIALFKSGDKESATNYRPISLLPTLSKLLERAVHTQLYEYFARNRILNEKQFGFCPKFSTTTSLTNFADEILAKMENGQLCGAVFLDLSKAIDTVNHSILLTKLLAVGVCHEDLTWFESYLSSRTLRTACGQELSDPLPCNIGVPQGSILGPLLFIVYINNLPDVVKHTQLHTQKHTLVSLYADDTVLYCFSDNPIDLEEQLNADLHTVCDWLRDNKLTLNIKKTKVMVIGSNRKLSNTSSVTVHVNGNTIAENVEHFSYLGVTLSTTMTWNEHVTDLSSKVNKRLGLLKRIRHLLPHNAINARLLFYNCLVLPLFDYGDLVWGDKDNIVLMESLQILQNKAAKIILNRNPLSSASDALNTLGWRKLAVRRYYHRCVHIFKNINGLCTPCLNLKSFQEAHSYNTRNKNILLLPKVKRNWGKQRLAYHAAKDWNTLESKVKSCKTIKEFKSNFYKHF